MIGTIQDLIIHPDYQSKGIGSELIRISLSKLPAGNWYAHTTIENYAFYEKVGFIKDNHEKETTFVYNGYYKAKLEGNR